MYAGILITDREIDHNSFPSVITNYIGSSGLYSYPELIHEYGDEWGKDSDFMLQRFSADVIQFEKNTDGDVNNTVELQKTLEFLVSPKSSVLDKQNYKATTGFQKKYDLLTDCFLLLSGERPVSSNNRTNDHTHCNMDNTNSVVAIAKTLEFIKLHRHLSVEIVQDKWYPGMKKPLVTIYPSKYTLGGLRADYYGIEPEITEREIRRYAPRPESDKNEKAALEIFMFEIIDAETYLFEKLKHAFSGTIINDEVCASDLISRASEIADLNGGEIRELHEIAERHKLSRKE